MIIFEQQPIMIFERYIPSFPLNQFIERFFYYKDYSPVHPVERFLPDGNVYLVIDLTDDPKPIYHNQNIGRNTIV